jgi:hypothetical protein
MLLPSGMVLVAGGNYSGGGFATTMANAELYDPTSKLFTTTGTMTTTRACATATLLPGNKVLVAGGCSVLPDDVSLVIALASAELYE